MIIQKWTVGSILIFSDTHIKIMIYAYSFILKKDKRAYMCDVTNSS